MSARLVFDVAGDGPMLTVQRTPSPCGYVVIDSRTGAVVAHCKTRAGAARSADRRDNEYGAYRCRVRAALPSESPSFRRAR